MLVKRVAPDYILVQRKVKNDLIKALKKTITEFYGENIEKALISDGLLIKSTLIG